jgi:hypothetical protein
MKTVFNHSLKLACLAALFACAPVAARAQKSVAQPRAVVEPQTLVPPTSQLRIESLESLADKAEHVVDVTLDENLLRLIPAIILKADKNVEEAKQAARIAAGFKGVYVRSFKFETEGQWKDADIRDIREQLKRPGWSRIVSVRSRKDGQNVEVYLMTDPASLGGLAVLATQPDELTVVNIVGKISLDDVLAIQGHFPGFPDLNIQLGDAKDDERKPETRPAPPASKKP